MDEMILQFDYEWREGDRQKAREIAALYVSEHRSELEPFLAGLGIEALVKMVSGYRDAKRHTDRIITDMWLLVEFQPQHISGAIQIGAQAVIDAAESIIRGEP